MTSSRRPSIGPFLFISAAVMLAGYFIFAAVQGEFGLFRRAAVEAESQGLERQLADLQARIAVMRNRTERLSDDGLDLDLLDQQARDVLGLIRGDEMVLR